MIPNASVEQGLLHVRINELERRLARLEMQLAQAAPQSGGVSKESGGPDEGLEGARLVAIELLSSGYAREEVTNYLRSTFGVADADADAVIAGTGLVPG